MLQFGSTTLPNLLLDAYQEFSLDEAELIALIHIMREQGTPTPSSLALSDYLMRKLCRSRTEVQFLLNRLHSKGITAHIRDPGKITPQEVNLQSLYAKLLVWSDLPEEQRHPQPSERHPDECDDGELVRLFESHFRNLSEFEYQRLRMWLSEDNWRPEVVREALRIAALNRNLNFTYIDRILHNWRMQGCFTLEQVLAENEAFQKRKRLQEAGEGTEKSGRYTSTSRSRRRSKPASRVRSIIGDDDETPEERRKRIDSLVQ